jgi:hypothetical protein
VTDALAHDAARCAVNLDSQNAKAICDSVNETAGSTALKMKEAANGGAPNAQRHQAEYDRLVASAHVAGSLNPRQL